MKAVISGAGAAGLLHALAYRAAGVDVAAIFDPDVTRASALAEMCGAEVARSTSDLVRDDAQFASVCGPPRVHVEHATLLASNDRTVLIEKPVAVSNDELASLRALPRCVPVVQWRQGRALRTLRRAISHGEFGNAPFASCDLAWGRDDDYFRARPGWGCGALLSIAIHAIDAMTWIFGGHTSSVSGMTFHRPGVEHETAAVALFRFESGAAMSLRISLDGGADRTRITLCGRGVTAEIEGGEADPTASNLRWTAPEPAAERLVALERHTRGSLGSPLLVPYVGSVVEAVREGRAPGDGEDLPSIEDTAEAHAAAILIAEHAEL